ncbi:MAG: hypothetical protein HC875_26995 [Anaerolineales bacterium]|nr:hypothetical protein [Anaerolineales bacterium]
MQAPTHFLVGILIEKSAQKIETPGLRRILIILTGVISHGILDKLARLTYHPPDALIKDWFWVVYHLSIAFLSIYILRKYWGKYKFGIVSAILPDFDWIVAHPARLMGLDIPFWQQPLHNFVYNLLEAIPFFNLLNSLPNWTLERKGVVLELVLLGLIFVSLSPKRLLYPIKRRQPAP